MLLARKLYNAGDLFWESLDSQERMLVLYLVGSMLLSLTMALARRRHERLVRELRAELAAGPDGA